MSSRERRRKDGRREEGRFGNRDHRWKERKEDPARSDPTRSDPTRWDPTRWDPTRSDPTRSDPARWDHHGRDFRERRDKDVDKSSRICTSSRDPSESRSRGTKSKSRHEDHRPGHHNCDERRKRERSSERRRERDRRKEEDGERRKEEDGERRSRDDEKRRKWSRSGEKSSSGSGNIVDASSSTYSSVRGSDGSSQVEITEQVVLTCDQRSHPPPGSKDVKLLPLHQEGKKEGKEEGKKEGKEGGKKEGDPELKTGTSTTLTASSSFPTSSLLLTSLNPIQTASSSNLVVVPGLLNQRQKQEEKKKLLWGDTSSHEKQQQKVKSPWEGLKFSNESQTEKFRKLMGIKSTVTKSDEEGERGGKEEEDGLDKKQEKMFRDLQDQYSIARMATHSQARGAGLGSFSRH